jgi:pyruvate kinase
MVSRLLGVNRNMTDSLMMRKTKIVCTIGPVSNNPVTLQRLLHEGMNIARINFSHGNHREHARYIKTIRQVAQQIDMPVAIMQDLPGPKDRTGRVKKGMVMLKDNSEFTLTTRHILGDESGVSIDWKELPQKVKKDDLIYISDGSIKLRVINTAKTKIRCKVINGGMLGDDKGVNVPGIDLDYSVTAEDFEHVEFGIKHGVDFIAASFVNSAEDIKRIRRFIAERNSPAMLIAKIERSQALVNIDEILEVADGSMVARGDLGIEIPLEKIPVAQKMIIEKCNQLGKPVIVATQMLESMVDSPRPTRAEVTDVANAIFDGTDAVMLSEETAIGKYPVEAVEMMSKIALEAEKSLRYDVILTARGKNVIGETDDAISYAACHTARQLNAAAIIAFTSSGSTARRVSKYRPEMPILAITSSPITKRQLCLSWGVDTFKVPPASRLAHLFAQGCKVALSSGVARKGDLVVITGGVPVGISGSTNLLKVEKI